MMTIEMADAVVDSLVNLQLIVAQATRESDDQTAGAALQKLVALIVMLEPDTAQLVIARSVGRIALSIGLSDS